MLIIYLTANIVLSLYFERKKWKLATVSHAVAFTVLLFCIIVAKGSGPVAEALAGIVGKDAFEIMHQTIVASQCVGVSVPLFIIAGVIRITALIAAVMVANEIVNYVSGRKKELDKEQPSKGRVQEQSNYSPEPIRLYILNCVMIC